MILVSCKERIENSEFALFESIAFSKLFSTFGYEKLIRSNSSKNGLITGIGMTSISLARFKVAEANSVKILCLSYQIPYLGEGRNVLGILKLYSVSALENCDDVFFKNLIVELNQIQSLKMLDERDNLAIEMKLLNKDGPVVLKIPLMNVERKEEYVRYSSGVSMRKNPGIFYLPTSKKK